jgi:hypothetical protein
VQQWSEASRIARHSRLLTVGGVAIADSVVGVSAVCLGRAVPSAAMSTWRRLGGVASLAGGDGGTSVRPSVRRKRSAGLAASSCGWRVGEAALTSRDRAAAADPCTSWPAPSVRQVR